MNRKTPNAVKKTIGTYRKDRDRSLNAPQFPPGATRPRWLTAKAAKAEWDRVVPLLEAAGLLTELDQSLLASYCQNWSNYLTAESEIVKHGQVVYVTATTKTGNMTKPLVNPAIRNASIFHKAFIASATKLGLTPLDRGRINAVEPNEDDELDRFLNDSSYQDDNDNQQEDTE